VQKIYECSIKIFFFKSKKTKVLSSQSISLGSFTVWSPSLDSLCLSTESWKTMHAQTENMLKVIENLTPIQKKLIADSNNPNLFYPHVGVFSKDYFIATILLKK
jgi:hypothetical protein